MDKKAILYALNRLIEDEDSSIFINQRMYKNAKNEPQFSYDNLHYQIMSIHDVDVENEIISMSVIPSYGFCLKEIDFDAKHFRLTTLQKLFKWAYENSSHKDEEKSCTEYLFDKIEDYELSLAE